jgi:hypothetical protein
MASDERSLADHLSALKRENAALRRQLQRVQRESDGFRRMLHVWAKAQISAEQFLEWDCDEQDTGQTILDVLAQFEPAR